MKITFILFILFLLPVSVIAKCDSLKKASLNQTGTKQVDAINAHALCFLFSDFKTVDSLAQTALTKAKLIDYEYGIGKATQNLGLVALYDYEEQEKAIALLNEALTIFEGQGDSTAVAKVLGDIANSQRMQGDLGGALKSSIRGLAIFENEGFNRGISAYSSNIGAIYMETGDSKDAIPYFRKALALIDTTNDRKIYSIQLGNLLSAAIIMEREDSVNYYFNEVLRIQKEIGFDVQIANTYSNMQSYYEEFIDPENPIFGLRKSYSDSAFKYAEKAQDKIELTLANFYKGLLLWHEGKYVISYPFLEKAVEMGEGQAMVMVEIAEAYYLMSDISFRVGDYKASREDLYAAYELNKEINKDKIERSVSETKARFSLNQSKKELDLIKKEKEFTEKALQQSERESARMDELAKQRKYLLFAIGAGLILSLIFGIIVFSAYKNKKASNALIIKQKEAVELQKAELDLQNKLVEERNKEITDSINYARRIQKAILPSEKIIDTYLPNSFVLYKPKDIVSGDFYWVEKQNDAVLFAVADCTGIGVPGAMVSVVCSNGLTRAVNEFGKKSPAEILNQTNEIIQNEFAKNKNRVADGMDIAICKLQGKTLTFAGAKRPLWICRDGEIIVVEGDAKSIKSGDDNVVFTEHIIDLEPNDVVYLFSNGFIDQFGGEEGKKLKLSNLKRFVTAMYSFESFKQKVMINKAFEDWKGGMEQMDDVCMMGVKMGS